jgi:hypothetical protein
MGTTCSVCEAPVEDHAMPVHTTEELARLGLDPSGFALCGDHEFVGAIGVLESVVRRMPPLPDAHPYHDLPPSLGPTMKRYLEEHIPTGGFLQSVLSNDFVGAVTRADAVNIRCLREIVWWLMEHAPSGTWGAPERYAAHLSQRSAYLAARVRRAQLLEQAEPVGEAIDAAVRSAEGEALDEW